jgi:hypothetical protein
MLAQAPTIDDGADPENHASRAVVDCDARRLSAASRALYLFQNNAAADHTVSAAELTVLFGSMGLVSGPL